jgi:hypothetical protein
MTSIASTTSVASMTSTASFHLKTFILYLKFIFLVVCYFLLLEKAPNCHFEPIYFALLVWFTYHPVEAKQYQKK